MSQQGLPYVDAPQWGAPGCHFDLLVEINLSPNRFSEIAKDLFSFFGQNFSYELCIALVK